VVPDPGRFEAVPLPPGVREVVAVAGRDGRDVWMMAKGNTVLHWDGARVTAQAGPQCFADTCCGRVVDCARFPARCPAPGKPCKPGSECADLVEFGGIRVTPRDVIADATVFTGGLTPSYIDSRLRGGRWTCEQNDGDGLIHIGTEDRSVGGASIRFETPGWFVNLIGGYSLVYDGRRIFLPGGVDYPYEIRAGLAALAPDDLVFWISDGRLWRGNGLTWAPFALGLHSILDLWATRGPGSTRVAWALGISPETEQGLLLRWEADGAVQATPLPGASWKAQATGDGFWLVGKSALYHFDGLRLTRLPAPLDVEIDSQRLWVSEGGETWLVGADRQATVQAPEGTVPAGAVFRMVAGGRGRP
jgi:hypothetical protein